MSDPILTECPTCGRSSFAKQLTAAGFQLKGSGWYATDFKGGSGAASAVAPAADAAPATSEAANSVSAPAKTEAAPATTACGGACACHS
jgi:acetylornithine deacetylase/succinyl-diaminopimelate desuccinylase-like protein